MHFGALYHWKFKENFSGIIQPTMWWNANINKGILISKTTMHNWLSDKEFINARNTEISLNF